ncbi:ABC transporter ATP-binding protein [Actinopolymorpha singaporensis]|uniref:ATP-binding cassette, subfamily B n=1 Tax=Actinopolymorpha singaporensis TaxID=117157 RepID=A0A1H1RF31_9ACTN|nr:ABC transporter ATP-binding protein [Actinopolymorpha singaporensis]SDS34146.1 ATP-binding cassette, subfamily B [Actinopolymorpha singaporensis]
MFALVRFSITTAPRAGGGLVGLAALSAATSLAVTVLVGQVIGATPAFVAGDPDHSSMPAFALLVAALVLVFTLDGVLTVVLSMLSTRLTYDVDVVIHRAITATMTASARIGHLESPAVEDESRRARGVGNRAIWVGLVALAELVRSRLLAIGSAVVVGALFSWPVALGLLATTWLVEWWSARISGIEQVTWRAGTRTGREADYAYELGMGTAAKELRVFGFAPWLKNRYVRDWRSAMVPLWRVRRAATLRTTAVYAAHLAVLAVAVWLLVRNVNAGLLGLTEVATVLAALLRLAMSANGTAAASMERATSSLRALQRLPKTARAVRAGDTALEGGRPRRDAGETGPADVPFDPPRPRTGPPDVRLEDVWFRYPGSNVDVLRGLTLRLGAGEAIGLVGLNGAGKSTLVHLLAGAYRPTAGRVVVDGVDLADLDDQELAAWQRRLAPVTQEFLRLPLTAKENVTLAEPADAAPDRLVAVAATAAIDSAIADLPRGWDTVLDRSVTDGGELSGGQWQRLALARALYAVDAGAGLLVLDEPAAALDVRSEAELVDRYLRMATGVTSLLISHRFSVVRNADRICVLDKGVIAEQGTHAQLLATGGRYAQMFELQAARYVGGTPNA